MGVRTVILPDFLLIGANKSGTSTIFAHLRAHPQARMCRVKEPMFFTSPPDPANAAPSPDEASLARPFFATTLEAYSDLFPRDEAEGCLYGEASTGYLACSSIAAPLIRKLVPDVRLCAVLREPAERAFSAYQMFCGKGFETRPFSEIVEGAPGETTARQVLGGRDYVRLGLYAQLLEPYIRLFDPSQLLVLDYDDFCDDAQATMDAITDHVGLERRPIDVTQRHNTAAGNGGDHLTPDAGEMRALRDLYAPEVDRLRRMFPGKFGRWPRDEAVSPCAAAATGAARPA